MECNHCKVEIETDDNFCWNCGHWTTHGYLFFKQDPKNGKFNDHNDDWFSYVLCNDDDSR